MNSTKRTKKPAYRVFILNFDKPEEWSRTMKQIDEHARYLAKKKIDPWDYQRLGSYNPFSQWGL